MGRICRRLMGRSSNSRSRSHPSVASWCARGRCVVGPFVPVDASLEAAVVQAIIVDVDSVVVFHKVDFNHLVAHTPFDVAGEVVPWGVAEIVTQ